MKTNTDLYGLTDEQVLESRKTHGANTLTPPKKDSIFKEYLIKLTGPFGHLFKRVDGTNFPDGDALIFVLEVACLLSIVISFYEVLCLHNSYSVFFESLGIFAAIFISTGLGFIFETQANKEFSILNQTNDDEEVKVIRKGNTHVIPKKDVVVDDIVVLNEGDEVPADAELLEAVGLHVDESTLTGEPVCVKTTNPEEFNPNATYPSNQVLRGTKVMSGHALCKVICVGDATQYGHVFREAQIDNSIRTPLDEQLSALSEWITKISYLIATAIVLGRTLVLFNWTPQSFVTLIIAGFIFYAIIKGFKKWSFFKSLTLILSASALYTALIIAIFCYQQPMPVQEFVHYVLHTFMIAVTLIVVAVPEGLPMAITLSLAYSMRNMMKTNNLVRRMHACETMGAATVICTDKTGTLTQNRMQVAHAHFFESNQNIIYEGIAVNSTASLDFTSGRPSPVGNPTEGALLLWLFSKGVDYQSLKANVALLDELPFSTINKYMATLVRTAKGQNVVYVKGAPEILLPLCSVVSGGENPEHISALLHDYQQRGFRTLAFAYSVLDDDVQPFKNGKLATDTFIFLGFTAISDPIRKEVPEAVNLCRTAGINIKIVTGDTPDTAKEIARQTAIWSDATDSIENIATGQDIAAMSDVQLQAVAPKLKIIARARPTDKRRLVEALQKRGEVVAVTGDGTNDAPALKQAHVGLSMGDGTAVAKEASDITIIDNSFASIGRAVKWGRSLYQNICRFLLFQLTVNVSACLLVLVGAFVGMESPLSVTQMLWINLIMDSFGAMALASLPPSDLVMKNAPRRRNEFILTRKMLTNIIGVGVTFFVMLVSLLILFDNYTITSLSDILYIRSQTPNPLNGMDSYEQTLLFSFFVWTHFFYLFCARAFNTNKSVFKSDYSKGFVTIGIVIFVGQMLITELVPQVFNVESMLHNATHSQGAIDLLIIVVLSSLMIFIREIYILFKQKSTLKLAL